jgi:CHAT domain-containing protein/tetratricopeptide (TPR) repeat protein
MPVGTLLLRPLPEREQIEAAIQNYEGALASASTQGQERTKLLADLGTALYERYRSASDARDLDRAILCIQEARTAVDLPPATQGALDFELAIYLHDRHLLRSGGADLEQSMLLTQRAATLITEVEDRARVLNTLGILLAAHHERTGRLDELNRCIDTLEEAVALVPATSQQRPVLLNNLAGTLWQRYERTGDGADLKRATALQARLGHQANSSVDALLGANQAFARGIAWESDGDLDDLDRAIQRVEEAMRRTPGDDAPIEQLSALVLLRFGAGGRLEDVDRTIGSLDRARARLSPSSLAWARLGHILATLQAARFEMTKQPADLDRAISLHEQALPAFPKGGIHWAPALGALASALWRRVEVTRSRADLDRAITLFERAAGVMAPDAPDRMVLLGNLGGCLWDRYLLSGREQDLARSERLLRDAIERVPTSSPRRVTAMGNLAELLRDQHRRSARPADLAEGVDLFRVACRRGTEVAAATTLGCAQTWGAWASERRCWVEAAEAYGYGWRALWNLFRIQLLRHSKELSLGLAKDIATDRARALVHAERLSEAVITIEHGRALLLTEALERDQADLQRLRQHGRGDLYDRYRQAAGRLLLQEHPQATVPGVASGAVGPAPDAAAVAAARTDLDAVVREIRGVAGYERFLDEPTFADVTDAARDVPLAYLVTGEESFALLVDGASRSDITVIPMPSLHRRTLRDQVVRYRDAYRSGGAAWRTGLDDTTRWLWGHVMAPLLAALSGRPRVVFVATGALGLLPLHAAWTADPHTPTGRRYALDEALITYAPNARSLRSAREVSAAVRADRLLTVHDPEIPPGSRVPALPYAGAEVAGACASFRQPTQLRGARATPEEVLRLLPNHTVLHLACHGRADLAKPLQSGFLLAGERQLTLSGLLALRTQGRLAVLSACETGLHGHELPDEVVGLPSGFLQAGFAGVVGSMWDVPDAATTMLMVRFYREWRQAHRDPAWALRAAQQWVRDTTNEEKRCTFAADAEQAVGEGWLPSRTAEAVYDAVVLGEPEVRSFAAITRWAAFSYIGYSEPQGVDVYRSEDVLSAARTIRGELPTMFADRPQVANELRRTLQVLVDDADRGRDVKRPVLDLLRTHAETRRRCEQLLHAAEQRRGFEETPGVAQAVAAPTHLCPRLDCDERSYRYSVEEPVPTCPVHHIGMVERTP